MARAIALWILILILSAAAAAQHVPSLFIFGDSFVDSGNNNYLNTTARCNHPPYGINFQQSLPTGRWTDGLLITDYLATYLNLPYPENFMDLVDMTAGANFASASAGILNTTGIVISPSNPQPFEEQISDFGVVRARSDETFGPRNSAIRISQSIFYINIGTNDVANAWRRSNQEVSYQLITYLLERLSVQILRLYNWGARKIVVVSAAIIGCPPLEKEFGPCSAAGAASAQAYNAALSEVLYYLGAYHRGLTLVYANLYDLMTEVLQNPASHGFSNVVQPCCPMLEPNGITWCSVTDEFCEVQSGYMFWDIAHPSSAFNRLASVRFWNGSRSYVWPMNIQQLASL